MTKDINALAIARDQAGSKVEELQEKRNEMAVKMVADPDAYSAEDANNIAQELAHAKKIRDFAQKALDDERNNMNAPSPVGTNKVGKSEEVVAKKKAKEITDKFISDFA